MPIKPPNLDDRRYADIVTEARALIPQYCPEWTNLGDADPGVTLVQLFAWMTEMTIYRLNRVPDKTYIHFLNFIGEERREAQASVVPLSFQLRGDARDVAEIPPFTRCSTRQKEGQDAVHFLTTDPVTVHNASVERIVAVRAGKKPMVREIPFTAHPENPKALLFGGGSGVQMFNMDPIEHGPRAYTPYQFLYIAHDDFRAMDYILSPNVKVGQLRIRSASAENLPIGALFKWEYMNIDFVDQPWQEIGVDEEAEEDVLGLPEIALQTHLPRQAETTYFGIEADPFEIPEPLRGEKYWIRGMIDYERWLAHRLGEDLEVTWRDDRGGEERLIANWEVRATGRNLEFFIRDMPPIRPGWTVQFTLVDRSVNAGRNAYVPRYRWTYRRHEQWEPIPMERVRYLGTTIAITGPLSDMATDGFNLRAERIETVFIRGFLPDLNVELTWMRPVELTLGYGPDSGAAAPIPLFDLPCLPFQPAPTLPPLLGSKFFIGSDLFENRAQKPVALELEVSFDIDGDPIEEPGDKYNLQLCYRASDTWRVVYTPEGTYNDFTFADLDPEGALELGKRKIRIMLDPRTQLKGIHRALIAAKETAWLRFELTRSLMTHQPDKKSAPQPITLKIHSVKLGVDGVIGRDVYEQPMPGPKTATVEYREHNRRLTRCIARSSGRLLEEYPFDKFIDVTEDSLGSSDDSEEGHAALYIQLDRPVPLGQRLATLFKTRGETFLNEGVTVSWEMLESRGHGRLSWIRLASAGEEADSPTYLMNRSGTMAFSYTEEKEIPEEEGMWLRALYRTPTGMDVPALPPVTHMLLNTCEGVNLHTFRMEKFSGLGVPHQSIQLKKFPVYLHSEEEGKALFEHPDRFPDIRCFVTEEDGVRKEWRKAPGNSMLTATKDDRVFVVDTVEGTLTFGNGIRGKMLPVGNFNVVVEVYHTVPGEHGNIGATEVTVPEGFADLVKVNNLLPATGGRNAESIEEIIRRAPSILTSRDRAVTRLDFEIIAKESSGEVSRAACDGRMSEDGHVHVVILSMKREGEKIPDSFMAAGLKEHVQRYLAKRCLVNVQPVVRLATFQEVDVSVTLRLRPNANMIQVREKAKQWVEKFLDAYEGGLDGEGWPFHGTLYAQDFGRMVSDLPEVRHVVNVQLYTVADPEEDAGWERGQGTKTIVLDKDDLLVVRHVRVMSEEGEE